MSTQASRRPKSRSTATSSKEAKSETASLQAILASELPLEMVDAVVDHHAALTLAKLKGDFEVVLLRGGKLAEAVMKIVRFRRCGAKGNSIHVEAEIRLAENDGSLNEYLRFLIPRQVRVLYDLRNKRGGGHDSFEPIEMDAAMASSISNWLLSELLRLFGGQSHSAAFSMARSLARREIPIVEEIGTDVVVLLQGASIPQEIGAVMLKVYPRPITRDRLRASLYGRSTAAVATAVNRLKLEKRIHERPEGMILTLGGLEWIESILSSRLRD